MVVKKVKGFTLIELVVAIAVVSVVIAAMVGMMLDSIRSSSKSKAIERVEEEGSVALREIRKSLMSADPESFDCPAVVPSDSITFNSRTDGRATTLLCTDTRIASQSAVLGQTIPLTSTDVGVSGGCASFVYSCNDSGVNPVVGVRFSLYMIGGNDITSSASRTFESTVVVRN